METILDCAGSTYYSTVVQSKYQIGLWSTNTRGTCFYWFTPSSWEEREVVVFLELSTSTERRDRLRLHWVIVATCTSRTCLHSRFLITQCLQSSKGSLQIEKKIKCENSHTLQTPLPCVWNGHFFLCTPWDQCFALEKFFFQLKK